MSLFLVMKKYDMNLKQYIEEYRDTVSWRTSLMILTQILEGVVHLVDNQVSESRRFVS